MRDLINKLTLLESTDVNIPKIAKYLKRQNKRIIELYFYTANLDVIDFGENEFAKEIKTISVSMPFMQTDQGTLAYFKNDDALRCTMYTHNQYYFSQYVSFMPVRDVAQQTLNFIGFTKETVNVENAKLGKDYGSINLYIPQTEKLLEVINAAYEWRQEGLE